jgi:hypothetical protein
MQFRDKDSPSFSLSVRVFMPLFGPHGKLVNYALVELDMWLLCDDTNVR